MKKIVAWILLAVIGGVSIGAALGFIIVKSVRLFA
jgi:hypothetical protein